MNCQNCHELIEPGATFCGNCGYPLQAAAPTPPPNTVPPQIAQAEPPTPEAAPVSQPPPPPTITAPQPSPVPPAPSSTPAVPSYALATPSHHVGETTALLALIFGIIGIVGAGFFIPIFGLAFGAAGLCVGTVSRRQARRRLAIVGLVFSTVAIAAGFAALVHNAQHDKNPNPNSQTGQSNAASKVSSKLNTPCYSFNLIDKYNVSNSSGSCDTTAFNGQSFTTSTNIYKIVATKGGAIEPGTFSQLSKQAIDKDVADNLPGFNVTSEGPSSFAGSLAYSVYAVNKQQDTAVVETGVLRQTSNGYNVFDILHAINGASVNLQALEGQWQWK
jgi:flagellar hook-basal body complex protein FliE